MKAALLRLLHVRRLLEERAGCDLQRKTAELRRLEDEAENRRGLAIEARTNALRQMLAPGGADPWLDLADAEISQWRKQRAEAMARGVQDEVAALREFRMARRMETQQAEALVSDVEREQIQERKRREQRYLDEWFQNRPSSESRRSG